MNSNIESYGRISLVERDRLLKEENKKLKKNELSGRISLVERDKLLKEENESSRRLRPSKSNLSPPTYDFIIANALDKAVKSAIDKAVKSDEGKSSYLSREKRI